MDNDLKYAQNHNPNPTPNSQSSPPPLPSSPPPPIPPPPSSPPPPIPQPQHKATPALPSAKKDRCQKAPVPSSGKIRNAPTTETEEERRLRKRREYERMKTSEKSKQQNLRECRKEVHGKTVQGHTSVSGSQLLSGRKSGASAPWLSGDGTDNVLKKPTPFLCKLRFCNELPDPTAKGMLMKLKRDPDRLCKYQSTSLEKAWKLQLDVKPDLGIPMDLLDLSVYNPPKDEIPLDPKDEELLRDDDPVIPVETTGLKRKDRPSEKGVSWLRKTEYITPFSMRTYKQSMTKKQGK